MSETSRIRTPRLELVATTLEHLCAELDAPDKLGALLGAVVPSSWPPGLYDRDAMTFFRERLVAGGPSAVGWYGWYAVLRDPSSRSAELIGAAGFHGPPRDGTVEIGFSTAPEHRGRGYTVEVVEALTTHAFAVAEVTRAIAETDADNVAARRVLERSGFVQRGEPSEPGRVRYERLRA